MLVLFGFLDLFFEANHLVRSAFQNVTQFFQGIHGDGLVVFQIVDGLRAEIAFGNQVIRGYILFLHGLPQRFVTNHICTHFR